MIERGYIGTADLRIAMRCADCGAPLQMKGGKPQLGSGHDPIEIGPVRTFHIVPCAACIEAETAPARALKQALAAFSE